MVSITRRKRTPLSRVFLIVVGCVAFLMILSLPTAEERVYDEVLQGLMQIDVPPVDNNNAMDPVDNNNAMDPVNNAKETIQGVPSETTDAETTTNEEAQTDPPQVAVPVSETPAPKSDPAATATTDMAAARVTTNLPPPVEPSSVEAMLQQAARDSTPKKDVTAQEAATTTQESYPPVNCETVLRQGYRQESAAAGDKSLNPNNDQIHARFIQKIKTPFWLSLHHETYDSTPYLDIMRPNERDAADAPGVYNQTIVTAIFQEILESSQDGIVLDVGANVGWYSLLSRAMGRTVEAFEPLQSNVFRLCESVFLNRWTTSTSGWDPQSSGVNIHNVAIGHRAREALFSNVGSEVLANGKTSDTQSVAVQIAPLDSIARAKGWLGQGDKTTTIALLKINLGSGGGESPVFQGAPTLLSSKIVKNIVMTVQSVDKLWVQTLLNAHYTVHKWGNWTGPDQDFTRLDVFEALRDYPKPMTIWWKQV